MSLHLGQVFLFSVILFGIQQLKLKIVNCHLIYAWLSYFLPGLFGFYLNVSYRPLTAFHKTTSSRVQGEHGKMQWSVRACELWDLSWHDLLEHLPTPSAFVTPSLPPIVVLNTPCGSMRSHLFTWKSSTGIVPVCSAFSRKSKWVLSFKRKSYFLLFFFWLFYLILQLITFFSLLFSSQPWKLVSTRRGHCAFPIAWALALLRIKH